MDHVSERLAGVLASLWGSKEPAHFGEEGLDDEDLGEEEPGFVPAASCVKWTESVDAGLLSPRALREMLVMGPLKEFNRPEFFMALQVALLVYYPAIALGIMYQHQDIDQTMQPPEDEQMMQRPSDTQFVQFIQSMITRMTQYTQYVIDQQLKQTSTKKAAMMSGDDESVRVEVMVKVPGHGMNGEEGRRQTKDATVWHVVYITI